MCQSTPAVIRTEKVLLVETHDSFREATAQLLEELGYRVVCAPGPELASQLYDAQGVDLLVAELGMSVLSGEELSHRLAPDGRLPTVLMVSLLGAVARRRLEAAGFRVIEKPFTLEELDAVLRRALGARA